MSNPPPRPSLCVASKPLDRPSSNDYSDMPPLEYIWSNEDVKPTPSPTTNMIAAYIRHFLSKRWTTQGSKNPKRMPETQGCNIVTESMNRGTLHIHCPRFIVRTEESTE